MTYDATETLVEHTARRIQLRTNARFDSLVTAFEQAVPLLPEDEARARLEQDPDWARFVRGLEWESPSGFVRVGASRPTELLRHAGIRSTSITWTIVHHAISARLFRHDPATALYAPLRLAAHTTGEPGTVITLEVPSAQLAGFDRAKIVQAGAELDRALGDLLEDLALPRPSALRR